MNKQYSDATGEAYIPEECCAFGCNETGGMKMENDHWVDHCFRYQDSGDLIAEVERDWELDKYSRMTVFEHLRQTVDDMERGEWSDQSELVLLGRDSESGIITICSWGDDTNLLLDACEIKHNHGLPETPEATETPEDK